MRNFCGSKTMIEENGHIWDSGDSDARCRNCSMKYDYYLDIKHASEQQPKRQELKKWLKCKKV